MNTYYLEMKSPGGLIPSRPVADLELREVNPPDGRVNQRFYKEVGGPWKWTYCAEWSADRWNQYLRRHLISTVILERAGEEIGYSELISRGGNIEILSFGLTPPYIGQGLGSASLEAILRFAWNLPEAHRVWLHTCDNDHPNALNNYQRRGFVLYATRHTDEQSNPSRD